MLISRRAMIGLGVASAQLLRGQSVSPSPVVVRLTVTDRSNRYILGLKASDFRVFEDDIPQKITSFAEVPTKQDDDEAANFYAITYNPDPSNHNEGFRKIRIEIIREEGQSWRIRHRQGYRPTPKSN
jgi:hypothetical protein